ncbi:T9SS type B sorting domain-containing protein [Croceivirga thetidis]|uniref:T9SS type B sorting domain-containing protein n=1 Tax=Croceivirga thetidis TaxID=2721623 RepID=A0ABX1GSK3_9FLAO|nr:T9SS type B sorting domain-containing protein [Croceivirga thetidis]NKI32930.1 T9SS type B sorting domain-containing protein [Croceivirga thetidis]
MKKLLHITLFCFGLYSFGQDCPDLLSPFNGETNVPVDTNITWEVVPGVPGYEILLGTTPGGNDLGGGVVGSATSYTPPLGLPENTEVFVTIILSFFAQSGGGDDIPCDGYSFTTEDVTTAPGCTQMVVPADGATNVSVFTNISWLYASTATSYDITIGTTPGAGDLYTINDIQSLSFFPPTEFPPNTEIFVQIIPKNENGSANPCQEFSFTTREVSPLPGCTNLLSPLNGSVNVPLTPLIEWVAVPGATGYRLTIGDTPGSNNVLDNAVFTTNSTFVLDFEPNKTFFITIVPFNDSGDAIGCNTETFSTLLGCGPFLDLDTGELVSLNPVFDFPPVFSFCENEDPLVISAPIIADGYRWFEVDTFGNIDLISEDRQITVDEIGNFQLEAYFLISQPGDVIECATLVDFEVVSSEIPTINNLRVTDTALGLRIEVEASGIGDYEYAIDDINGPYKDSNVFNNVTPGSHVIYVRDKNGCGVAEERFEQDLTVEGFPKFFSPNGDGVNDFWQFIQPDGQNIVLTSIQIFNRFGLLLKQIDQNSRGWDGTFNGNDLPASDYWFIAIDDSNKEFRGHFSLKR